MKLGFYHVVRRSVRYQMDPEKSIILTELRDRYNQVVIEHQGGEPPDVVEIENGILDDIGIIPQSVIEEIKRRAPRMLGARTRARRDVRSSIARAWGPSLAELDKCLALADVVFARLSRRYSPTVMCFEGRIHDLRPIALRELT